MVHEERRLTFTKDAVTAALRFWLQGGQLKLPPGHIVGAEPMADGGCRLRMEKLGGIPATVELSSAQMAVVFIGYARHIGIPIPRKAAKSVQGTANGGIMMRIEMSTTVKQAQ
jgi:hypothetical protein